MPELPGRINHGDIFSKTNNKNYEKVHFIFNKFLVLCVLFYFSYYQHYRLNDEKT